MKIYPPYASPNGGPYNTWHLDNPCHTMVVPDCISDEVNLYICQLMQARVKNLNPLILHQRHLHAKRVARYRAKLKVGGGA